MNNKQEKSAVEVVCKMLCNFLMQYGVTFMDAQASKL